MNMCLEQKGKSGNFLCRFVLQEMKDGKEEYALPEPCVLCTLKGVDISGQRNTCLIIISEIDDRVVRLEEEEERWKNISYQHQTIGIHYMKMR